VRVFVGIGLPADVRDAVDGAVGALREKKLQVSWVPKRNLHITLKFLGETASDRMGSLGGVLSRVSAASPSFSLAASGAGAFPSVRNPRVLWIGCRDSLELAGELQQNMEDALSEAGFPREDRRFHPHITTGRVRGALPPGWGERFVQSLSGREFGTVPVSSLTLFESRLSPGGAIYTVLQDFRMAVNPGTRENREEIS
jgi:RNA 2',3'-cyclic 3'-phosphodiesterase